MREDYDHTMSRPQCYHKSLYWLCVSSQIFIFSIAGTTAVIMDQLPHQTDADYISISAMLYGFLGVPFCWMAHLCCGDTIQNIIIKCIDHRRYCSMKDRLLGYDPDHPNTTYGSTDELTP
jgi:hypothetical protein